MAATYLAAETSSLGEMNRSAPPQVQNVQHVHLIGGPRGDVASSPSNPRCSHPTTPWCQADSAVLLLGH